MTYATRGRWSCDRCGDKIEEVGGVGGELPEGWANWRWSAEPNMVHHAADLCPVCVDAVLRVLIDDAPRAKDGTKPAGVLMTREGARHRDALRPRRSFRA